jgi:nitrogenase-associated protein
MASVIFYKKPGCDGNARQKQALRAAGHTLDVRDLLTTPWTPDLLRPFFGTLPVSDWFNRAAPQVKSGAIVPEAFDEAGALAALCATALLIRRPLMQVGEARRCGFDAAAVDQWIGLQPQGLGVGEACPRTAAA